MPTLFFPPKDLKMKSDPRHFPVIVIMVLDFCLTSQALKTEVLGSIRACISPDPSSVNMTTNNPNQTST